MARRYTRTTVHIDSYNRRLRLLVFQPKGICHERPLKPAVLWLHGGGYAIGMAEMFYFTRAKSLVTKFGAVVAVPDYCLSPKAPYPAALEDCYAALLYLRDHCGELGADPRQLMVGGESAGGGLTAALCMLARDRGEVSIAFQMPLYPMLDDRDTESSRDNYAPVWNTKRNHAAWKLYLKGVEGEPPPYAAPARQTNYADLPAAYTFVGDIEPFYCETLAYVEALRKAGVDAKVDVYPGWFHAYDIFFPYTKKGRKAIRAFEERFSDAVRCRFVDQPDRKLNITKEESKTDPVDGKND